MLERKIAVLSSPVVATLISRQYRIDEASVRAATATVERFLDEVGRALSDGRRFLCGDALTAADVTFASLAAVALFSPSYPFPLPDPSRLPAATRDVVLRFRDTEAGRYVERLYRDERRGTA